MTDCYYMSKALGFPILKSGRVETKGTGRITRSVVRPMVGSLPVRPR